MKLVPGPAFIGERFINWGTFWHASVRNGKVFVMMSKIVKIGIYLNGFDHKIDQNKQLSQ